MSEKQIAVIGETDRLTQIKELGSRVSYAPKTYSEKAELLQTMLNNIGLHLRTYGFAGRMTSDAYFFIGANYLKGDKKL